MRVLIYEPLPDMNRAPIIAQLAKTLMGAGHDVLVVIEEKLIYTLLGQLTSQRVINCSRTWCRHIGIHKEINVYKLKTPWSLYWRVSERNFADRLQNVAALRRQQYRTLLDDFAPDRIFVWNGQHEHLQDFMSTAKRTHEGKFIYMECGWFPQRGTIYFDKEGVNAASSIAKGPRKPLSDGELQELEEWQKKYTNTNFQKNYKGKIFVPLQVEADTNITLYSPFKTMQSFIDFLEKWIPEDYEVVFRPHPLSNPDIVLNTKRKNFGIEIKQSVTDLILSAEIVIGINSTVLLESLAFKKSVIAFGDGFLRKTLLTQDFRSSSINSFYSESSTLHKLVFQKQDLSHLCLRSLDSINSDASSIS